MNNLKYFQLILLIIFIQPVLMHLRSQVTPEERLERLTKSNNEKEIEERRPYIDFKGKIKYYTDVIDCAMICDQLINTATGSSELLVLGFDMEWPFSFQTGPSKTALIQISPDLNICYLLHVSKFKNLPKSLCLLLSHPNVRLTGNNIKNDIRKLARDFSGVDAETIINNCIDSGVYANSVLPFQQRWSLEKLVGYLLKMKINKSKKVRISQWAVIPLSAIQKKYAATDSYASLKVFLRIKELETQID